MTAVASGSTALRGMPLRLFLACWLVYALHFATNTVREIYPALSLGDHLSFDVSEYVGLHPDIFTIPGRGAFINNNPGASILGALPYALARPLIDAIAARVAGTRAASAQPPPEYDTIYPMAREFHRQAHERGVDVKLGLGAAVMQSFLMAPLAALAVVLMFSIIAQRTGSTQTAVALALLYGFATPIFYRTAQLNHNVLVAHCALAAFALIWCPWKGVRASAGLRHLAAGLLCGLAVLLDYSGVIVVVVLGGYALWCRTARPEAERSWADIAAFVAGSAVGIIGLLAYQWSSFGHPLYPAQSYMRPTRFSVHGHRGMTWPQPDLLWQLAFDLRFGLFTSAPILLLALYVPGWWRDDRRLLGRAEVWCAIALTGMIFLFTSANEFARLQFNSGVRHVVPVTPFLFLLAGEVLWRLPATLAVIVGAVATYWSWCLSMYRDVEQGWGVFESSIHITRGGPRFPWLTTVERMGYVDAGRLEIPLLLLMAAILLAIWRVGGRRS